MKRIKAFLILLILISVTGCNSMTNTPTKKVEQFLNMYQTKNEEVLDQLEEIVSKNDTMSNDQKEKYIYLMQKQYQNLNYKIKEENEDGKKATVVAEIEVFDYGKSLSESEEYISNNRDEFLSDEEENTIDNKKVWNYKLNKMTDVKDKTTYTIHFTLTKEDNGWKLNDISDLDRQKIHGIYY